MHSSISTGYARSGYAATYVPLSGSSGLEAKVLQYSVESPVAERPVKYINNSGTYQQDSYVAETQPVAFLNPSRPVTPFVGQAFEISGYIRQAFCLTTGEELPGDVGITVAPREELLQKNPAFLNHSVVGISLNQTQEIFVAAGKLDEVMLTIGHELGHVIRKPARTAPEEEAKAFAFEAVWAKSIFDHDVAGLKNSINAAALMPAKNGLHDAAFNFVKNNSGEEEPFQLFNSISTGGVTPEQISEGARLHPTVTPSKTAIYSTPGASKALLYGGYLNKSRVQNLPPPHTFFWGDLGKGIYGMYVPLTQVETINEKLLRKDIEQLHKTLGHEYSLHHVMGLPDGYVVEALEEAMFWTAEDEDRYKPKKRDYVQSGNE